MFIHTLAAITSLWVYIYILYIHQQNIWKFWVFERWCHNMRSAFVCFCYFLSSHFLMVWSFFHSDRTIESKQLCNNFAAKKEAILSKLHVCANKLMCFLFLSLWFCKEKFIKCANFHRRTETETNSWKCNF